MKLRRNHSHNMKLRQGHSRSMKLRRNHSHNMKLRQGHSHNNTKLRRNRRANLRRNRTKKDVEDRPFLATRLDAFPVVLRKERLQRWRVASPGFSFGLQGKE
jgi:hypothetical protein